MLLLGQELALHEWLGIAIVVTANVFATLNSARPAEISTDTLDARTAGTAPTAYWWRGGPCYLGVHRGIDASE